MAPPTARRFGFSKRAQYGTFFGYIAAFVGALAGAAILIAAILNRDAFSGLRGLGSEITAPAGNALAAGRSGVHSLSDSLAGYFTSGPAVARMERELAQNRVQFAQIRAVEDENRKLKALLGLKSLPDQPVAFARLIASTASSTRRYATISAGTDQGIAVGMPVRTPLGLVGRVLDVSGSTGRVLLVTDPESMVPVQRARDGVPAFAQGHGDGTLQLRLISLGINPLKPGDVFVTSGSGGLYAPGTAVAVVATLTRDGAIARVLADPSNTDFVALYPVYALAAGMGDALAPVSAPIATRAGPAKGTR